MIAIADRLQSGHYGHWDIAVSVTQTQGAIDSREDFRGESPTRGAPRHRDHEWADIVASGQAEVPQQR